MRMQPPERSSGSLPQVIPRQLNMEDFTFGDDNTPYKLGSSIYTSNWRVGWNFGGAWEGVMHPGTAYTFDRTTGERFDIFPYIADLIELDPLGDVEL